MADKPMRLLCGQSGCNETACAILHWPGGKPSPICYSHKKRAEDIAAAIDLPRESITRPVHGRHTCAAHQCSTEFGHHRDCPMGAEEPDGD